MHKEIQAMGMLKEFKEFAMRGNVVDLAVGVVIGTAFGKIVASLVEKIVMPIVGYLQGGVDFKDYVVTLPVPELAEGMKAPTLGVGMFLQTIIDFIIVAFAIFLAVKLMNSLKKAEAAAPAAPPEDVMLLREIRDALKK
ncbi:MAG: large-conductance mechanosensitive channel protein MscL [Lacipirellulaceae bacterium]